MFCILAALSGCHRDSGTPPPPSPMPHIAVPIAAKRGPSAEELTVGMVEAASQGKSQVPVEIKFDLKQRPTLGRAIDINIAVMPQIDASPVNINIAGGDGLVVAPAANQIDLPVVQAGQVYRQSIKVTPTADGVLLLTLMVSLKHDDLTESRAFSIPLIVER
jgi:hypothetical protein